MKRKRGNKKGNSKKHPKVSVEEPAEKISSADTEDNNSGADDIGNDLAEVDSGKEVETTTLVGPNQPEITASTNSTGLLVNRPVGNLVYGRMKVKIKTSKTLDSQSTATDAPSHSDTDKSSQQAGSEKNGKPSEKIEDSENSLPDTNSIISGNAPKKAGSIKIKSSWNIGSSSISPCTAVLPQKEETPLKEPGGLYRDPGHKDHELKASLEIIKKIMKMDAAEPFNAPVNPIALGIPDYFDVIDTPMDFGTICSNLEGGLKYKNSEDVFKDVQYIWNNCYKYNNRGDYVVELMKRVKKNFTKYWMAAGLYSDHSHGADASESKDTPIASSGKMHKKSIHLKHKTWKRHGVKRHKDDCLCAICVMMRRRQEREESTRNERGSHMVQEAMQESPAESPYGGDSSSNMENSTGPDADSDTEEKREVVKLDNNMQQYNSMHDKVDDKDTELEKLVKGVEILESFQPGEGSGEKSTEFSAHGDMEQVDARTELTKMQCNDKTAAIAQNKPKGLVDKNEKAQIYRRLSQFENPHILKLSGTLFTDDIRSIWSGPHSFVRHRGLNRNSSIHEAINSIMK